MGTSVYCMRWQLLVEYLALVFLSVNIICIVVFILCILNSWKKLMSDEDRIVSIRTLAQGDGLILIQIQRYRCKSCTCLAWTYSEHSNRHKEKIFELSSVYHLLTEGKGKSLWESVAVPGIVSNSTSNAARLPHPHKWKSRNFVLSNIKCLYRRHRPCKQAVPFYSAGKGRGSHTAGQVSVSVFVWPQYVCSLHQLQYC